MPRRLLIRTILLLLVAAPAAGQSTPRNAAPATDREIRAAAALITPAKVLQRISVIADDSMGGRNTPSRGLEQTAQYLADNYRKWGLQPLGDSGTWFQRYTLERVRPAVRTSYLEITDGGITRRYTFDEWAMASGPMTGQPIRGPIELIAGAVTADDVAPLRLTGAIVVYATDPSRPDYGPVMRALTAKSPAAIISLVDVDPAAFKAAVATALHDGNARPVVAGTAPGGVLQITMHDSIFGDEGAPHGAHFAELRAARAPVIATVPPDFAMTIVVNQQVVSSATAPNVVAVMEGNDPVYRNEYVMFSAHMDHIGTAGDGVGGCTAKGDDKICNGADDDGSGTTGVMSIAEAVASLKGRTRRSVIFLNVSGEEKGLLGSAYFTQHPTVPLDLVVADVNMDMIGRNNPDSIVVIGKEHSDMGTTLARVRAAHPELHLVAADDIWPEQSFYTRSDHYNFARKGVPILFFFSGMHPQYHQPDDEVRLIDTSKLSRVAQLAFYLGLEISTTAQRPKWNPDSYAKIVRR